MNNIKPTRINDNYFEEIEGKQIQNIQKIGSATKKNDIFYHTFSLCYIYRFHL